MKSPKEKRQAKELKQIKKIYGEDFMHLCKSMFSTILEKENDLLEILKKTFYPNSRSLYNDIIENELRDQFVGYIYNKYQKNKLNKQMEETDMNPYELLEIAGYELYECKNEREVQSYRKYYENNEELCTFYGKRLETCYVFFAIKKNAEKIERSKFTKPEREDEYGTSVISIQFSKKEPCVVSIKNRYNHTVTNPDATFGNDLDNIIPGLTYSFSKMMEQRGLVLNHSNIEHINLPNYTMGLDGRLYKYNTEINGIYYCPGNIIIDNGKVIKLDSERYLLLDYFIFDRKNKCVYVYDSKLKDSFTDDLQDIKRIESEIEDKESGIKLVTVIKKDNVKVKIRVNNNNEIIEYINESLKEVGNNFLHKNTKLQKLDVPNLEVIKDGFLKSNKGLDSIDLSKVKQIGNDFLYSNEELKNIYVPNLCYVGNNFLYSNKGLTNISIPNLIEVEDNFLYNNEQLQSINIENTQKFGNNALYNNKTIKSINMPSLISVKDNFLYENQILDKFVADKLENVGNNFLRKK